MEYLGSEIPMFKKGQDKNADKFMQWVEEGCFHALEKKYLKELSILVIPGIDLMEKVCESFTFRFDYKLDKQNKNEPHMSVCYDEDSPFYSSQEKSKSEIKDSASKMIKTLLMLNETLKPLPMNHCLSIRLLYHEYTPSDYQPQHFLDKPFHGQSVTGATSINIGETVTNCHRVNLKFETDFVTERKIADDEEELSPELEGSLQDQYYPSDEGEENKFETIRCICKSSTRDDNMVRCVHCGRYQHEVCFGFDKQNILIDHCCPQCYAADPSTCLEDSEITNIYHCSPIQQKTKALKSRSWFVVKNMGNDFSVKQFQERLGVSLPVAKGQLKHLIEKGYLNMIHGRYVKTNLENTAESPERSNQQHVW